MCCRSERHCLSIRTHSVIQGSSALPQLVHVSRHCPYYTIWTITRNPGHVGSKEHLRRDTRTCPGYPKASCTETSGKPRRNSDRMDSASTSRKVLCSVAPISPPFLTLPSFAINAPHPSRYHLPFDHTVSTTWDPWPVQHLLEYGQRSPQGSCSHHCVWCTSQTGYRTNSPISG